MILLFGKITATDREAYLRAKLVLWTRAYQTTSTEVDLSAAANSLAVALTKHDVKIPSTALTEIPTVASDHIGEVEDQKKCALQQVQDASPLLPEETLESDEFTFLQAPLGNMSASTPFLRRTTNFAELYYFFPSYRVDVAQAKIVYVDLAPMDDPAVEGAALAANVSNNATGDAVTSLATDLAKALLKWAGMEILSKIFPEKAPGYFQEVYAELRKIVHQEITSNTIDTITGAINGIATWSKYEYIEMKKQGEKPDLLIRLLRDQSMKYHKHIQTLMVDRFAMPGIQVFLVAGSLHFFLYQEIALVGSERATLKQASQSSDAPEGLVELYAAHAESTFAKILEIRLKHVEIIYDPVVTEYPPAVVDRWYWKDSYTGTRSKYYQNYQDKKKKWHSGEPLARQAWNAYNKEVGDALNTLLGDPLGTAKKWREADKNLT